MNELNFNIREAFYVLNSRLYFDGKFRGRIFTSDFNRLRACIEDNFDGKKIDYEQALEDFETNRKEKER